MVESKDSFPIKVRTFDSSQFEISVTSSLLVSELKSIIENTTRMPSTQQRLIYKGKVLKNDDALAAYKIEAGHVLQLVGNQAGSEPPPLEPESERTDPLNDIIRLALEANPAALLNRRRRRYHRRREIDINERLETIRQNLQTIEGMIQSMSSAISINSETSGFELNRRQFSRGQWLDVKDTVDQWLEAQVVDIQNSQNGSMVFLHYNGWPTRWDEWIEASSPRIQPLHTHTPQSLISPMHSPFPVISTDAESLRNTGGPHDINDFILQTSSLLEHVKGMMERYYNLSIILRHERAAEHMQPLLGDSAPVESESVNTSENDSISMDIERSFEEEIEMTSEQEFTLLTSQLAPLLDRAGRLLTDLAAIIGSSAQRPQEDNASVSSSLITNESGLSNTGNRLALQIPVMPSPSELAALNPRLFGPDIDIHIHAIFPQRDREEPERTPCWRQLS